MTNNQPAIRHHHICFQTLFSFFYIESKQPRIKPAQRVYTVKRGDTICLPCELKSQYSGHDVIYRIWYKDGNLIKMQSGAWPRFTSKPNCLSITDVDSFDHGSYSCVAQSQHGSTNATRVLNVIDRLPGSLPPILPTMKPLKTLIPYLIGGMRFVFNLLFCFCFVFLWFLNISLGWKIRRAT